MTPPAPVGRAAFLLGLAGLLPQAAALALIVWPTGGHPRHAAALGALMATLYAGTILSFLGGIWWGLAMRLNAGQGALAGLAVLPALIAVPCMAWAVLALRIHDGMPTALIGLALLLTLVVDRHLVSIGLAPANWMRLRLPLSAGLGGLTIAAGLLAR